MGFLDDFQNRGRRMTEEHGGNVSSGGRGGGSDFRFWPISLKEGVQAPFYPMRDAEGNPVISQAILHATNKAKGVFACTHQMPGFHGKCVFCHQAEKEAGMEYDDKPHQIRTTLYRYLGVWDPNYYVPQKTDDGKYVNWNLWQPSKPGLEPPPGSEMGMARHFRLTPSKQWPSFISYAETLERVCRCVAESRSPKVSRCFFQGGICPRCECILYTEEDLDKIGDHNLIRANVFGKDARHQCRNEEEGGCWTPELVEAKDYIIPRKIMGCGNCGKADPVEPFDGMALVTRTGQNQDTNYTWIRDEDEPWEVWYSTPPPEQAVRTYAKGKDFSKMWRIQGLEKQAEILKVSYPFDPETKNYKLEK